MTMRHHGHDGCGTPVKAGHLLDIHQTAEHVGVSESSLHTARARAEGRVAGAVPGWFRPPTLTLGNSQGWSLEAAEEMRQAREQQGRKKYERRVQADD